MIKRLKAVMFSAAAISLILILKIAMINNDSKVISAASGRGQYVLSDKCEYASIYDRNGKRLNNR
ncbi:MAG: hypothetical protein ACI4I1_10360, partial [Oscillospiraceae bacterium]